MHLTTNTLSISNKVIKKKKNSARAHVKGVDSEDHGLCCHQETETLVTAVETSLLHHPLRETLYNATSKKLL